MKFIHPEIRVGEVLLTNILPIGKEQNESPEKWFFFKRIKSKTKRIGKVSYTSDGKKIRGYPVFVSKKELPSIARDLIKQILKWKGEMHVFGHPR